MILWEVPFQLAQTVLSFLAEIASHDSEAAQMETEAHQESQILKSKETETHSEESDKHLKQQGLDNSQSTGCIQNGEYHMGTTGLVCWISF